MKLIAALCLVGVVAAAPPARSSYQTGAPRPSYPSAPRPSYQTSAPKPSYQPSAPKASYQPSVPKPSYQPSIPKLSYQPSAPKASSYQSGGPVSVLKYNYDNAGFGGYFYNFEQSDGTQAEQRGEIRNEGRENESLAVTGSYAWIGPDGVLYKVIYTADENGFKPEIEQGPGGAVPNHIATLLG